MHIFLAEQTTAEQAVKCVVHKLVITSVRRWTERQYFAGYMVWLWVVGDILILQMTAAHISVLATTAVAES